jgi:hypothetical protein
MTGTVMVGRSIARRLVGTLADEAPSKRPSKWASRAIAEVLPDR